MNNILPFKKNNVDLPIAQGEAFCIGCKHIWDAKAPVGTNQLECPSCGTMKGKWRFEFSLNPDDIIRVCNCGNELFYIMPEGHMCANCGIYQLYDD